jgi:hypothetical protein
MLGAIDFDVSWTVHVLAHEPIKGKDSLAYRRVTDITKSYPIWNPSDPKPFTIAKEHSGDPGGVKAMMDAFKRPKIHRDETTPVEGRPKPEVSEYQRLLTERRKQLYPKKKPGRAKAAPKAGLAEPLGPPVVLGVGLNAHDGEEEEESELDEAGLFEPLEGDPDANALLDEAIAMDVGADFVADIVADILQEAPLGDKQKRKRRPTQKDREESKQLSWAIGKELSSHDGLAHSDSIDLSDLNFSDLGCSGRAAGGSGGGSASVSAPHASAGSGAEVPIGVDVGVGSELDLDALDGEGAVPEPFVADDAVEPCEDQGAAMEPDLWTGPSKYGYISYDGMVKGILYPSRKGHVYCYLHRKCDRICRAGEMLTNEEAVEWIKAGYPIRDDLENDDDTVRDRKKREHQAMLQAMIDRKLSRS